MRVRTVPPVRSVDRRESPPPPRGSLGDRGTARTLTAMNRLGTALLAAVEAIVTVGVGIGIALVPLTLLWGFEYGLQVDWDVFWKAAGSVWLVGHGVDVTFHLGAATAGASGIEGAGDPIHVTLAALGFAVVTAWLGGRAGRRFAETSTARRVCSSGPRAWPCSDSPSRSRPPPPRPTRSSGRRSCSRRSGSRSPHS